MIRWVVLSLVDSWDESSLRNSLLGGLHSHQEEHPPYKTHASNWLWWQCRVVFSVHLVSEHSDLWYKIVPGNCFTFPPFRPTDKGRWTISDVKEYINCWVYLWCFSHGLCNIGSCCLKFIGHHAHSYRHWLCDSPQIFLEP